MMTPILFSQNSSTRKLYTILDLQLRNILDSMKERGLLFDYNIKLPSDLEDSFILDLQNYIIRGIIVLKLNILSLYVKYKLSDLLILLNFQSLSFSSNILNNLS